MYQGQSEASTSLSRAYPWRLTPFPAREGEKFDKPEAIIGDRDRTSWDSRGPMIWDNFSMFRTNRSFPSTLVPLFQRESKCETVLMKMTLICMKKKLRAEVIFIWKVSLLDSLWNRGTRELGNGLLRHRDVIYPRFSTHVSWVLACMLSRCMIKWWELRDSLADFHSDGREEKLGLFYTLLCSARACCTLELFCVC